jgi:hypothetical protein
MTYAASTSLTQSAARGTTYSDLMTQGDANGQGLSYLGSEEKFLFLKDLERRNLVVPVVGDFAGPKALRAVGAYIRDHGATVTAFYLSNVEQYLRRASTWPAFCSNVATFPLDDASLFIRPSGSGFFLINGQPGAQPISFQWRDDDHRWTSRRNPDDGRGAPRRDGLRRRIDIDRFRSQELRRLIDPPIPSTSPGIRFLN